MIEYFIFLTCLFLQLLTVVIYQLLPMELWTHQVEQTISVQQSIHVTQDMSSMEISQEHVRMIQPGVGVNQLVMVCGHALPKLHNR